MIAEALMTGLVSFSVVVGQLPIADGPAFAARRVQQTDQPVYGLALGEFDPANPGNEIAALVRDASVIQLSPSGFTWPAMLRHKGLTTIGGMIDRPTVCIGDVHSGYAGNEIVIDGGKYLTVIRPAGGWSHEVLFTVGGAGAGWGSRVGDIDPAHPGDEILHSFEGVMDRGTIGVFRESAGVWQEQIVFNAEVVMDTAVGEFDSLHAGNELVAVTEMGPAYEITPGVTPQGYWPSKVLWDDMANAAWVVKIADVDPTSPGNELVYGSRYNNRIMLSRAAGSTGHQLQVLFTGTAPPGYQTVYDIAVGDIVPAISGLEILGVDWTGSLYLVSRSGTSWRGRTIWQDPTGPLHAVIAADFLPDRPGDEILVAGQSGAFTLLMAASRADLDRDGDVDVDDFDLFRICVSGPQIPMAAGCSDRDFDDDGDVDQDDFGRFQCCYAGPDAPADPACAG